MVIDSRIVLTKIIKLALFTVELLDLTVGQVDHLLITHAVEADYVKIKNASEIVSLVTQPDKQKI